MEKEVKIIPPEGYEIDRNNSSLEKIVFKRIDNKPRSWEEYCKNTKVNGKYFIDSNSDIIGCYWNESLDIRHDRNLLPSKELAEAFRAMMQLVSLRQAWIGDWKAYPGAIAITRSCDNRIIAWKDPERCLRLPLSFPTQEMAIDFMNCFKDLLEVAKPLI